MEFKRKIYSQMMEWKKSKERKALVIEGLRQIGKTYIVNKFAKENYKVVYSFDFRANESHRLAFKRDFNVSDFKEIIFELFHKEYIEEDAVLVFDEIGDCPDARAAIKYIIQQTKLDIIATGSLLGVKGFSNRQERSPSVGFNHFIEMYPMDFEEFLWANSIKEETINIINRALDVWEPIDEIYHKKYSELFKHYILTGGMPEAVQNYVNTHDFVKVISTNEDKLKELQGDFGRIIDGNGKVAIDNKLLVKTKEVYDSLVGQLAKSNKKFQFSFIKKGARAKEYEEAIVWLDNAGMITRTYNLTDLALPLAGYVDNECYKLYYADIGLYVAALGMDSASLILSNSMDSYGGYVYEGIIADILHKANFPLYYSDNGKTELDFIIQEDKKICILEVKMNQGQSKSAKAVIEGKSNRKADTCYKVYNGNMSKGSYYFGLPHYALPFLLQKINKETKNKMIVEEVNF